MLNNLVPVLQAEERQLVTELRATPTFQRLDAVRRVIALYSTPAAAGQLPATAGTAAAAPTAANADTAAATAAAVSLPDGEIDEHHPGPQAVREGNKAVSVVRAALAAVTG